MLNLIAGYDLNKKTILASKVLILVILLIQFVKESIQFLEHIIVSVRNTRKIHMIQKFYQINQQGDKLQIYNANLSR